MARFYIIIFLIKIKLKKRCTEMRDCFYLAPWWGCTRAVHYVLLISFTEKDVVIRISKTWRDFDWLQTIWKSALPEQIKKPFFKAVVESVLLYGSFARALTKRLENKLNGTYTRMIRAILDISTHPSKERLYGNLI